MPPGTARPSSPCARAARSSSPATARSRVGQTVIKHNARKVRPLGKGGVIAGFAGATADAFTLFERLEAKLEQYPGQLTRACVELAKDWRTDRYLRRLEAMMLVADKSTSLVLTGTGDVLEPEDGVVGIGSGGNYALAAARALMDTDLDAEAIARKAMAIAADICVYTNTNVTVETLDPRDVVTLKAPITIMTNYFSPREIVSELDRYIIGQNDAKRAVAIALRNRWRRQQLDGRDARGGAAEEHPDDRADRRRQDRDFAPPGQARRRAVPQGRGDQVHRGRLCRPRRRADHPRPRRDRHRRWSARRSARKSRPRPSSPPRSAC